MRDLMADNGGELVLVLCSFEDALHDTNLPARHRKRVHRIIVKNRHFPGQVTILRLQHLNDGISDTGNVVNHGAIRYQRHGSLHFNELPGSFGRQLIV